MVQKRQITNVPIRLQSSVSRGHLSQPSDITKNDNSIFFATVTKVDYSKGRVQYIPIGNYYPKNTKYYPDTYTALLPIKSYGVTEDDAIFGSITPVQTGNTVLLGNIEGKKGQVVVLGIYPDLKDNRISEILNIDTSYQDTTKADWQDILWQDKTVYPSQQVKLSQGDGTFYRTFDGKTFVQVGQNDLNKFKSLEYDVWDDNGELYNDRTSEEITAEEQDAPAILLVHQANDSDSDTHLTRALLNEDGTLTYTTLDKSLLGNQLTFSIDRTVGLTLGSGVRTSTEPDNVPTESISLFIDSQDNTFKATKKSSLGSHTFSLDKEGFKVDGVLVVTEGTADELAKQTQAVQQQVNAINDSINTMGGQAFLESIPTKFEAINYTLGTITGTTLPSIQSQLDEINGDNGKLPTLINSFNDLTSSTGAIAQVNTKVNTINNTSIPNLQQQITDNKNSISNNSSANAKTISDLKANYDTLIKALQDTTTNLTKDLKTANDTIDSLTKRVVALEEKSTDTSTTPTSAATSTTTS